MYHSLSSRENLICMMKKHWLHFFKSLGNQNPKGNYKTILDNENNFINYLILPKDVIKMRTRVR